MAKKKAAVKAEVTAEGTEAPKKKKKATKRKTKKAAEADARVKLFWGVFSPTMKRVAVFHYMRRN